MKLTKYIESWNSLSPEEIDEFWHYYRGLLLEVQGYHPSMDPPEVIEEARQVFDAWSEIPAGTNPIDRSIDFNAYQVFLGASPQEEVAFWRRLGFEQAIPINN